MHIIRYNKAQPKSINCKPPIDVQVVQNVSITVIIAQIRLFLNTEAKQSIGKLPIKRENTTCMLKNYQIFHTFVSIFQNKLRELPALN